MKKMTKVLALLTVMAMLATLFVAVPASAITKSELTTGTPTVSLTFTSDAAGNTVVDPDTLAVGTNFYTWVEVSGIPEGAYIVDYQAFVSYDKGVVTPYNVSRNRLATNSATAKNAVVQGTGTLAALKYNADEYVGIYDWKTSADWDNGYMYGWCLPVVELIEASVNGEDIADYTDDTFLEVDSTGHFRAFGVCFQKTAEGKTGVTISGNDKMLNGKAVAYPVTLLPACSSITLGTMATTNAKVCGAEQEQYTYIGGGTAAGAFVDASPRDSEATEAPATDAPTDEPTEVPVTEEPTEAPTEVPEAQGEVAGAKEASNSEKAPNAFFYQFTTPVIPGAVTGLTATFQIDGKDAVAGDVTNINLTGISNVALKIAAIVKNIPEGQETTPVTTNYTLNYLVGGSVEKALQWSRTDSLN